MHRCFLLLQELKEGVVEDTIKEHFGTFGKITSSCLKADKKGRPFAFVSFETHEEVFFACAVCVCVCVCGVSALRSETPASVIYE